MIGGEFIVQVCSAFKSEYSQHLFIRLSPDRMEERDGFLTMTRAKIEAAVKTNGLPGIMVAHSVSSNYFAIFLAFAFKYVLYYAIICIHVLFKMGNAVFRYFQEWLRVQMREEAYERYVRDAEDAAAARVAMAAVATAGDVVPPRGPFWRGRAWVRHNLPGGVSGSDFDDSNDNEEPNFTHDTDKQHKSDGQARSQRKYPKLWELAKAEGDRDFIDWLGKHIWTYVGLAAPLLGAPGPLRSVLSGENMGLPFTDEEARSLELCELTLCCINRFCTICNLKTSPLL